MELRVTSISTVPSSERTHKMRLMRYREIWVRVKDALKQRRSGATGPDEERDDVYKLGLIGGWQTSRPVHSIGVQ